MTSFGSTSFTLPAAAVCVASATGALGATLFGEPARSHDYLFLRCASRGKATGIHCDAPFFTRMTARVANLRAR